MIHDLGWLKKIKILDSLGNLINPATNEKLDELKSKLQDIYSAVDDLELSVDNIEVDADQINLNTDELETKVQSVRDQLDVLLSTRASELTLSNIKTVLDNIKTVLDSINSDLDVTLSTRASEATLIQVRDYLDTVETKLQSLIDKNQAKETDGNLGSIKSNTDKLDVNLSTRISESNFNNKIGEVQASPTQYTLLARLKDLWDKLVELFNDGVARIKLWDGTYQAGIDSANHVYVAGKSAHGVAPTGNPVSVSGVDGNGLKRRLKTDANGRLEVISPTAAALANTPVQICFQKSSTAVNNYEWQEVLEYIVPTGYDFNAIGFCAVSAVANESAKAISKVNLGSFVGATNTFTDGEYWVLPRFAARLFVYVTTAIGSTGNDTITITYTNQIGTTGRTGIVTIPKNSLVGTRLEVAFQSGDYGVIDVTNVIHSQTGQVGNFNIEGNMALFNLVLTTSNVQYDSPAPPLNAIVVPAGGKVYLQYLANSAVTNIRGINLIGSLAPR